MSPHPFVAAVGAALAEHEVRGPVLVACSGGGDSLALLRACVELGDAGADLLPIAAHFDHRQRPDSRADGSAVASWCEHWSCESVIGRFDGPPGASEATLRGARYAWLREAARARRAACVLTGHTADDQAETVLLRVIRGTGVAGLAGIPASGPLPGGAADEGVPRVVRPLLSLSGAEARAFLIERGIAWREDPTNAAVDFARNRLRHEILPRLAALNPRVTNALIRLAATARDEAAATDGLTDALLAGALLRADDQQIALRADRLRPLPEPARRAVLRRAWRRAGWPERRMGRDAWIRLSALRPGDAPLCLPHGVRATYDADRLVLHR